MTRFLTGVAIGGSLVLSLTVLAGNAGLAAALGFAAAIALAFINYGSTASLQTADAGVARVLVILAVAQVVAAVLLAYLLSREALPAVISLEANAAGFFAGGAISLLVLARKLST